MNISTTEEWVCKRCLSIFRTRNGAVGPYYHPCSPKDPLCRTCIHIVRLNGEIEPPVQDQLKALGIGGAP